MIRLRQRHSAVPLLRSLGHCVMNLSINIPPLRCLGKPTTPLIPDPSPKREREAKRAHLLRSIMRLISAFAWFIASSAGSSPLFAFDR